MAEFVPLPIPEVLSRLDSNLFAPSEPEAFDEAFFCDGDWHGQDLIVGARTLLVIAGSCFVERTVRDEVLGDFESAGTLIVLHDLRAESIVTGQEWLIGGDVVCERTFFGESRGDFATYIHGDLAADFIYAPDHHLAVAGMTHADLVIAYLGGNSNVPRSKMYDVLRPEVRLSDEIQGGLGRINVESAARLIESGESIVREAWRSVFD